MVEEKPRKYCKGIPTYYGVYEEHKTLVMTYGGKSWNENTISQYDGIVLDYIIPNLKNHDQKRISDYAAKDFDEAMQRIRKKGKNRTADDYAPLDDSTLEKHEYLMRAVVWAANELNLCENVLEKKRALPNTERKWRSPGEIKIHQKKSLSIAQERKVIAYLRKSIYQDGVLAGLLLMFALGLRNNEACGVNFGYIREFQEYPGHYYIIIPQTTDLGSNTLKILGKTKNSGRKVPLPKLLVKLLLELWDYRIQKACEEDALESSEDLPIVCKHKDVMKRAASSDLTRAAKEMFLRIGMRHEEIIELNHELMEEASVAKDELDEDEFREIEADPTAYLLRRNFATHLAILGLRDVEIWYVIGHKIEDAYVKRRAFSDERLLFAIKRKLDERPLLNEISMKEQISIQPGMTVPLEGSKTIVLDIPVEQVHKIKIIVTAKEPGDEIEIRMNSALESGQMHREITTYAVQVGNPVRTFEGMWFYHNTYTGTEDNSGGK